MQISSKDISRKYDKAMKMMEQSYGPNINVESLDFESTNVIGSVRNDEISNDQGKLPKIKQKRLEIFDAKKNRITMSKRLKVSGINAVKEGRNKSMGLDRGVSTKFGEYDSRNI